MLYFSSTIRSYAPDSYLLITNYVHYSSNPVLYFFSTYDHPAPLYQYSKHIQNPMMFPYTQTGSGPWIPLYKVHVGLKGRLESRKLNECCHCGIALNFDELRTTVLIDRMHHLDCELDNVYFQYSSFSNFQYFSLFVNVFHYLSIFFSIFRISNTMQYHVLIDRVHHLDCELGCCAEQCVFDNICICICLIIAFLFDW